jgi:hypothetical protein
MEHFNMRAHSHCVGLYTQRMLGSPKNGLGRTSGNCVRERWRNCPSSIFYRLQGRIVRIRRPSMEEPGHEKRQVRRLRIEGLLQPRELRPDFVRRSPGVCGHRTRATSCNRKIIERSPQPSPGERLGGLEHRVSGTQTAMLEFLPAAARAGIIATGCHGIEPFLSGGYERQLRATFRRRLQIHRVIPVSGTPFHATSARRLHAAWADRSVRHLRAFRNQ